MTLESTFLPSATTAIAVSSQLLSIAIVRNFPSFMVLQFPLPHDERVLAIILIIAFAKSRGRKAEPLLQLNRRFVADADLQRITCDSVLSAARDQRFQHCARDMPAAIVR